MHVQPDFNNLDYGIHNTENDSQNGKTNGKKWPYSACPCSFLFQDTFFQGCKTFWPWTFQPQGDGVRTATKKLHQKFFKYPFLGWNLKCHQLFKIQIKKGGKVLLWNQIKSRMEACYSELVLAPKIAGYRSEIAMKIWICVINVLILNQIWTKGPSI